MAKSFHLPRELRDMIYRLLRDAMGRPIDLDLTYTCKRVADEMRGLALTANTMIVSTFYSLDERHRAREFDLVIMMMQYSLQGALKSAKLFLWDDICAEILGAFPQFTPVLDMIKHDTCGIKQGPWDYRHRFNEEFAEAFCNTNDIRSLLNLDPAPWTIPTQYDLRQIVDTLGGKYAIREYGLARGWMGSKEARLAMFRYSAAAVAIRFLDSNTPATRAHMRDIVLTEDRESVSNPECHAMGLIPYCQGNPGLRIERRVSLWQNAFFYNSGLGAWAIGERTKDYRDLEANEISFAIARWVIETLPLISAGMPAKSFTLVLDGEGDPQCTQVFHNVVLRDAAWQHAMDECFQSGDLPP
ncbi:hypothetical protein CSAL01_13316 [Colletotrichum salicis]|uniref:Uncharacterized protein n=1 Tax=Colletotrichum salicis TaxID=1209931 RepID=A0A135V8S7_9PEZI|nr:hypothetical protein CSAL01_13316 [Colletotrichum salicis]